MPADFLRSGPFPSSILDLLFAIFLTCIILILFPAFSPQFGNGVWVSLRVSGSLTDFSLFRTHHIPTHASALGMCKAPVSFSFCSQIGPLSLPVSESLTATWVSHSVCCPVIFLLSFADVTELSYLLLVCPYLHFYFGDWGYSSHYLFKLLILLLCLLFFNQGNSGRIKKSCYCCCHLSTIPLWFIF